MREVPAGGGSGTLAYLLADRLGSTVEALDAAGNTIAGSEIKYWPYGATRTGGVPQTDKLYTGQQQEPGDAALGLYNYKARFYSTTLGRFVSVDPVVGSVGDPQSWNAYTYVRNNPLRLVDPSGEYFEEPSDSAPSVKTKGFCGRDCRAMKSLASRGIYTVGAALAADRADRGEAGLRTVANHPEIDWTLVAIAVWGSATVNGPGGNGLQIHSRVLGGYQRVAGEGSLDTVLNKAFGLGDKFVEPSTGRTNYVIPTADGKGTVRVTVDGQQDYQRRPGEAIALAQRCC